MATGQLSNIEIADALKRARELATNTANVDSVKRPYSGDSDSYNGNPPKRLNSHDMAAGNPITALGNAPFNSVAGLEPVMIEQFQVPDNCVGLIIGRGGESITNIQNETGCRIQMAQPYTDASGKQMRGCTLTGSKSSIDKAKRLLDAIIDKAGGTPPPVRPGSAMMLGGGGGGGSSNSSGGGGSMQFNNSGMGGGGGSNKMITVEMLIPGTKCGLVIGKGGDTIKQLQERAGVKMVMIQESNQVTGMSKPLRIIGEPDKVDSAKRMVEDIMNSRDDKPPGTMNDYGSNMGGGGDRDRGGGPKSMGEVIVPRTAVGVIIGKSGETIKRLTIESGAKIQFKQDDYNAPERTALIIGTPDQIQRATSMITDLVNRAMVNDSMMPTRYSQNNDSDVFYMHVPANKTGLVIGKGGETVKQICAESGAKVELSREPAPSETEKVFVVRGTPHQIHHAQHLIRIKVGDLPNGTPLPPFTGSIAASANEQQFSYPNFNTPTAATSADPSHAWAQYYAQYYQQPASTPYAPASQGGYPSSSAASVPQPASTNVSAPTINPQTGQPDYSAQWAEYYRSLGMHEQAAAIEQQARANQQTAAQAAQPVAPAQGGQNFGGYGQSQQQYPAYGQPAGGYQYPHQF